MMHDDTSDDERLPNELAGLPRTLTPSGAYTDRVIEGLRAEGLVRQEASRARRLLVAASWFVAGVGTGAVALSVLQRAAEQTPVVATADRTDIAPAEPAEWY